MVINSGEERYSAGNIPIYNKNEMPLAVNSKSVFIEFQTGYNFDYVYRFIVMDRKIFRSKFIMNEVESERKIELFSYFENTDSTAHTVMIDMPVKEDTAYFEINLAKSSTQSSRVQLGLIPKILLAYLAQWPVARLHI
jgi:hypothetical protein